MRPILTMVSPSQSAAMRSARFDNDFEPGKRTTPVACTADSSSRNHVHRNVTQDPTHKRTSSIGAMSSDSTPDISAVVARIRPRLCALRRR